MSDYVQVITTTDSEDEAHRIAGRLVEERLAGCVQILGPMVSVYRWEGAVESAQEWLCLVKTSRALYVEVEALIRSLHSYDVPEIVVLEVAGGSADYLGWLGSVLRGER